MNPYQTERAQQRKLTDYIGLGLRGMGMGAADVVPGVSGGTIALITGIYEELIDSLKSVDLKALRLVFSGNIKSAWAYVNGNFLVAVLLGVAISVGSLARGITWLLHHEPILLWSFFFGLILASAYAVGRRVRRRRPVQILALLIGIGVSYYITIATPAQTPQALVVCVLVWGAGHLRHDFARHIR